MTTRTIGPGLQACSLTFGSKKVHVKAIISSFILHGSIDWHQKLNP